MRIFSKKIFYPIWELFYFPIWWYSQNLKEQTQRAGKAIRLGEEFLGFFLWLKNLFTPMFGQYDLAGRLISFFMRLFQIIFRGIGLILWILIVFLGLLFWLILPPFLIYQIIFQLII